MGYKSYALVVMTNSDVYYLRADEAQRLRETLFAPPPNTTVFFTTDTKSGAKLSLVLANISSVVVEMAR